MPCAVVSRRFAIAHAVWKLGTFDVVCGAVSVPVLVFWAFINEPTVALVSFVVADQMAAFPTVRKSWLAPSTESPRLFFLGSTNCAITVLTLTKLTTAGVLFPGCILVTDLIVGLLIVSNVGPRAARRTLRRNQTKDGVTMASTTPLTAHERKNDGQSQRDATPRGAMAKVSERPADYDPVARLMWQGESRRPDLLSLRYSRMLANPLSFYRGNALLMAEDLARGTSTSLEVQICGDAHLSNFNLFSSPERHLVFDVNDFDETDQGPFEWDLKRLVASLAIASSHLGHSDAQQERIARWPRQEYRESIRRFAGEDRLAVVVRDVGHRRRHGRPRRDSSRRTRFIRSITSLPTPAVATRDKAYAKLIVDSKDGPRIVSKPPLLVPLEELNQSGYLTTRRPRTTHRRDTRSR